MGTPWASRGGASAARHGADGVAADAAAEDTASAAAACNTAADDRTPCLSARHRRYDSKCDVSYGASNTHGAIGCSHERSGFTP